MKSLLLFVIVSILCSCKSTSDSEQSEEEKQALSLLNQLYQSYQTLLRTYSSEWKEFENFEPQDLPKKIELWQQLEVFPFNPTLELRKQTATWPNRLYLVERSIQKGFTDSIGIASLTATSAKGVFAIEALSEKLSNADSLTLEEISLPTVQVEVFYEALLKNQYFAAENALHSWQQDSLPFLENQNNLEDFFKGVLTQAFVATDFLHQIQIPAIQSEGEAKGILQKSKWAVVSGTLKGLENLLLAGEEQSINSYAFGFGSEKEQEFKKLMEKTIHLSAELSKATSLDSENLTSLQDNIATLILWIKVEFPFALNTSITFTDNDGD